MLDGILNPMFLQEAGRSRKKTDNILKFTTLNIDPTIGIRSDSEYKVISIKNSEIVEHVYPQQTSPNMLNISADLNSEITIIGDITAIGFGKYGQYNLANIVNIDVSKCNSLAGLSLSETSIEYLDVTKNVNLTDLVCDYSQIQSIDLGNNILLEHLKIGSDVFSSIDLSKNINLIGLDLCSVENLHNVNLNNINSLQYITVRGIINYESVAISIANAITNSTHTTDGHLSVSGGEGTYYSTIADAATAKGWTIEQL